MPPQKIPTKRRAKKDLPVPSNGAGEYAAEAVRKTPEQIDLGEVSTAVSWMRTGTDKFFQVHNYNPDELVARKGLKTYKKMRHDEQVKAALKTVKQAAVSTGWEIEEPKIESGEEIADEMKRFVEFNVGTDAGGGEMAGTMEQKLMEMMTAIDFGYSVTEPTLKYIEYGEFEGFTGIKELKTRDPENIDFVTDQYGNLLDDGVVQFGRRLPTDRFAIYSHDKEFDNWYGTSMLRAAYRPWWIKDTLLKFMTIAMERYGEPIAVATTKKKLTEAERSRLEAMFKNLQNRTLITIPEFITLEFKVPQQRAGDAYASVMAKLDSWISRAILLPTKMGMSGESETGNYSQASEEFDLFLQIIGYLRRVVAALANDRIIKPVVDLNYEVTGGNYPKFAFKSITQERKDSIYKLFLEGLGRSALTKVPADENRLRNLIDFPELTEEEQAQAEAEKQAMRERFQPEEGEAGGEEGEEEFFPFVRDYHLEGEHDQCDHSPTGECVDPNWEKSPDNPVNDPRLPKPKGEGTKGKFPPRTNIDDVVLIKLKSGRRVVGQVGFNDPSGKSTLEELKTRKKLLIDKKDIDRSWKLERPRAPEKSQKTIDQLRAQIEALRKKKANLSRDSQADYEHKFSSTQVDLPKGFAKRLRAWVDQNIPDDDLSPDESQGDDFHVTVKYGLHTTQTTPVAGLLSHWGKIKAALRHIDIFDSSPEYDVLIVNVESPDLVKMNRSISDNLSHTDTQPGYRPHMTLAYLKKGRGEKWRNSTEFSGQTFEFDTVWFSTPDDEFSAISLTGPFVARTERRYQRRKPNAYERRVNFEKIDEDLNRLAFDVNADVRKLIRKAEDYAINQAKALIDKGLTATDVQNFKIDTGQAVAARFNQFLMDTYKQGADEAKSELPKSRQRDLIGVRFFQGLEPREALAYLRAKADFDMKGVIDETLTERVRRELIQHLKGGKTMAESVDNIRRIFEPFVGDPEKIGPSGQTGIGFPPGEFAPENVLMAYRLENIIRTNEIDAFNEGRKAIGDAAGDYVIGYNYSAILDSRTTEVCRFLDGFKIRKDDPRLAKLTPPVLYQCRSILTFITTDDLPVEFTDDADLDEGVRMVPAGFK